MVLLKLKYILAVVLPKTGSLILPNAIFSSIKCLLVSSKGKKAACTSNVVSNVFTLSMAGISSSPNSVASFILVQEKNRIINSKESSANRPLIFTRNNYTWKNLLGRKVVIQL